SKREVQKHFLSSNFGVSLVILGRGHQA
ncbi:hypothetical protein A2U01_0109312, partial [Trifolium medium]|nr:hypothetical protein [Trifolium medium]